MLWWCASATRTPGRKAGSRAVDGRSWRRPPPAAAPTGLARPSRCGGGGRGRGGAGGGPPPAGRRPAGLGEAIPLWRRAADAAEDALAALRRAVASADSALLAGLFA